MRTFGTDTFGGTSGTLLQNWTGGLGAWTKKLGSSDFTLTSDGQVTGASAARPTYILSGFVPPSADYGARGTLTINDSASTSSLRLTVRSPSGSAETWYGGTYSAGSWLLQKRVAGTLTLLGTWVEALSNGAVRDVEVRCIGTTIKLLVAGVERVTTTDSAITAAGYAGLAGSGGNAHKLDAFQVFDFVSLGHQIRGVSIFGAAAPKIRGASVFAAVVPRIRGTGGVWTDL